MSLLLWSVLVVHFFLGEATGGADKNACVFRLPRTLTRRVLGHFVELVVWGPMRTFFASVGNEGLVRLVRVLPYGSILVRICFAFTSPTTLKGCHI